MAAYGENLMATHTERSLWLNGVAHRRAAFHRVRCEAVAPFESCRGRFPWR
jgi:hypothetical protein